MELIGTIENIKFRNEENGYTVVMLSTEDGPITAVGKFPMIAEGEKVAVEGTLLYDNKYGDQFKCDEVKILKQNTTEGIIRYLSSGLIRGIGPKLAERIVDMYGLSTLEIIEYNHEALADVKGISESKAEDIFEAYNNIRQMQNAVMFLQSYDISINMAVKIYNIYSDKTIEIVKNNPYRLIEDVDGIGFITADRIAKSIGIEENSKYRLRAGLVYTLKDSCERAGNTLMPKKELVTKTIKLLELSKEIESELEVVLVELQMDNYLRVFYDENIEVVMTSKYYNIEKSIAERLYKLLCTSEEVNLDVSSEIEHFSQLNGITLHETQKDAISMAINKGVCVITGGPGTGKTTIVKCILHILTSMGKTIKLLAPTGRASKRLSESTGKDASTIHRALDLSFKNEGFFTYNEDDKLPYDCVIVDEVSMVDAMLMNSLVKVLELGTKLILVGDKDQLPSVGAGNVLSNILTCGVIPFTNLTKIYRQDDSSLIVTNAHLINSGKMPIIDNTSKDFFYETKSDSKEMADSILSLVTTRIPKHFGIDCTKIQVLAPLKAGMCGVERLNLVLQDAINPSTHIKDEVVSGSTTFRIGDKVMQISNNYNLEWQKNDEFGYEKGTGIFNGDIGYVTSILRDTNELEVTFEDGRECKYMFTDLNQLVLSYAITIHKSQGSEFDAVIIPLMAGSPHILTRNLIYTAVTRAKKMVILVGPKENLARMVKNNYTAKRYSMLDKFLLQQTKDQII